MNCSPLMVIVKSYHLFSAGHKRWKNRPDSEQLRQRFLPIVSYKRLDCSWMLTFRGRTLFSNQEQCEHTDHKKQRLKSALWTRADIVHLCVFIFYFTSGSYWKQIILKENKYCLKLLMIRMQMAFGCEFLQMVQTKHGKGGSPGTPAALQERARSTSGRVSAVLGILPFLWGH